MFKKRLMKGEDLVLKCSKIKSYDPLKWNYSRKVGKFTNEGLPEIEAASGERSSPGSFCSSNNFFYQHTSWYNLTIKAALRLAMSLDHYRENALYY
ncbi:hypothetical protein KY289_015896 [Solanum tuberosum]|nr:hypothetical protein KY289_015896 [Solanum tuberosum]